jgi:hypothetical protein
VGLDQEAQVTGPLFAQTLILGWLRNPCTVLEELAQQAAALRLETPATGLEERMTRSACGVGRYSARRVSSFVLLPLLVIRLA